MENNQDYYYCSVANEESHFGYTFNLKLKNAPSKEGVAFLFHSCINYISVNMDKWSQVTTQVDDSTDDSNINSDLSGGLFNELRKLVLKRFC